MFEFKIKGIPCWIDVLEWDYDEDCYKYEVYARGNKPAKWLSAKIDDTTHNAILEACLEYKTPDWED